jgi:hypothetical protein
MFTPSRRAVVVAAAFALAFASTAPSALADRSDHDDDTEEESDGLLDLIDVSDLLGGLPLLGGGFDESSIPTIEGLGLPTLEALGLPVGDLGLDLEALEALGLPLEGLGLPALDGLGLGGIGLGGIGLGGLGLDGIGLAGLPLGSLLSLGGVGGASTPLGLGSALGILDVLSGDGLGLNLLVELGVAGAASSM